MRVELGGTVRRNNLKDGHSKRRGRINGDTATFASVCGGA
jgi:hypothetical protein